MLTNFNKKQGIRILIIPLNLLDKSNYTEKTHEPLYFY